VDLFRLMVPPLQELPVNPVLKNKKALRGLFCFSRVRYLLGEGAVYALEYANTGDPHMPSVE